MWRRCEFVGRFDPMYPPSLAVLATTGPARDRGIRALQTLLEPPDGPRKPPVVTLLSSTSSTAVSQALARVGPSVRGKFLAVGDTKLYVRGVTYGALRTRPATSMRTSPPSTGTSR